MPTKPPIIKRIFRTIGWSWLAIFGFCFFYIASFPGYFSPDPYLQYVESLLHAYTDWHPPVMAWWWSVLNLFFKGPEGMLFFHLALLWSGLTVLYFHYRKQSKFACIFLLIGFLPWITNFEGQVLKDTGMAYCLLLATTLLITTQKNWLCLILIVLALLYAYMVRQNAVFAIFPIFWLLVKYIKPTARTLTTLAAMLLLTVCFQTFTYIFNYKILHAEKTYPALYMMEDDLTQISRLANKNLFPMWDDKTVAMCAQRAKFSYYCFNWDSGPGWKWEGLFETRSMWQHTAKDYPEIKTAWLNAIKNYPREYIYYRTWLFWQLLSAPTKSQYMTVDTPLLSLQNVLHIHKERNYLTTLLDTWNQQSVTNLTNIFVPWFWLISGILLGFFTLFFRTNSKTLSALRVLCLSSICYILGYIPITPSTAFRYVYWSIVAINLALAVAFIDQSVQLSLKGKNNAGSP